MARDARGPIRSHDVSRQAVIVVEGRLPCHGGNVLVELTGFQKVLDLGLAELQGIGSGGHEFFATLEALSLFGVFNGVLALNGGK